MLSSGTGLFRRYRRHCHHRHHHIPSPSL
jgi:hypothetical protein